jgi:hypothetical protein
VQHADLADRVWTIRTEPREKGNPGSLRLPPMALDIIAVQPRVAGNPYVFVGRGGALSAFNDGKRTLDRKLREARVQDNLPRRQPCRCSIRLRR